MKNWKSIFKFLIIFILSFISLELIEYLVSLYFNLRLDSLKWGWLAFIILYGFKYHIFCCLLPTIWASYKCRHKHKCNHEHCE